MKITDTEPVKGDIIGLNNNEANVDKVVHYIVYLEVYPKDTSMFIGAMLTHSDMSGNIPLNKEHFIEIDKYGKSYQISFNKSLVVNHPLFKKSDWLKYDIVGKLSEAGIKFIEDNIAPYVHQFHTKI